ncbi:hypothetical protein F5Y19DRAFT_493595 [Xylariaceae sp. FL1651]|nr:hypothetical protein F5Y19DRAFT_493595 [Xylariaceae sp. FL1651]
MARLSYEEHLEYLILFARSQPDHWVCEACVALHRVQENDTPNINSQSLTKACPKARMALFPINYLRAQLFVLNHQHIQLALKYTRTRDCKHRDYLKALTAPVHGYGYDADRILVEPHPTPTASYSVYPKVVLGSDGNLRYLVMTIWDIYTGSEAMSRDTLGDTEICPHITRHPVVWRPWRRWPDTLGDMASAALKAREEDNTDACTYGACNMCRTEFCVQPRQNSLRLTVWQDFGTEDSPINPVWESLCGIGTTGLWEEIMVDLPPGNIQHLFESQPDESAEVRRLRRFLNLVHRQKKRRN